PREVRPLDVLALQEIGAVCGLAVGLVACGGLRVHVAWSLIAGALGAACPLLWLRDQVKKRLLRISRALPYHPDLFTLAVEAGLAFTRALGRVLERRQGRPLADDPHPPLP